MGLAGRSTTIGKLNVVGALTLGTTSTAGHAHLTIELGGTTTGTLYDQVSTTGNVSLKNVNLDLSLANGYGATIGINDTFTIILNGGSGTTTGTFANAPGNQIVANGITFSVNYGFNADAGAAGNDVQLTVVAVPEPGSWTLLANSVGVLLVGGRFRRSRRPQRGF